MQRFRGRWSTLAGHAVSLAGVMVATQLLLGCAATTGDASSASDAALVTPSDESDTRRRARLRMELAASYFDNGQTAVALDELKQVLAIDASYPDAYNLRGLIYMRLNDHAQAEDSFRRALALRGNDGNLLHNYGWLLCIQKKYPEADQQFSRALAVPTYTSRGKTLMARGVCQVGAGQFAEAEHSLQQAYELDAANPVVGYHLSAVLLRKGDAKRAQFYIRRLNNGSYANAESLWLGIKVERMLGEAVAMRQLGDQLRKRFPESKERSAFERGAFDE